MEGMSFNKGWDEWYCGVVTDKLVNQNLQSINYHIPIPITTSDIEITNTGTCGLYLSTDSPHSDKNPPALTMILVTETGHIQKYTATYRALSIHLTDQLCRAHILPNFNNSLVGIEPFCDADFKVLFTKETVTVFDPTIETILTVWRELHSAWLWWLLLLLEVDALPPSPPIDTTITLVTFSTYDILIIEELVRYFHASAGFLVTLTWIADIN